MIIRINDITPEGRDLNFVLDEATINARVQTVREQKDEEGILPPAFNFHSPINASLHLELEGTTVMVAGNASARYTTSCSRCAEDTTKPIAIDIRIFLKPHVAGKPDDFEVEDVALGYYYGEEVDCSSLVEEHLILALPMTVLCSANCKGLCADCGANLNLTTCSCAEKKNKIRDERFSVLARLKIQ